MCIFRLKDYNRNNNLIIKEKLKFMYISTQVLFPRGSIQTQLFQQKY
jgi:hypothetical protein